MYSTHDHSLTSGAGSNYALTAMSAADEERQELHATPTNFMRPQL
jgi:ATP-dependent protease HslVU (ClpYQ) peptidase subunit